MSIYETGAQALRDTTKWLIAFIPIATIVVTGGALGPRLLGNAHSSRSPFHWAVGSLWVLIGIGGVVVGVVLVVSSGAKMLSTQPGDFTLLFTTDQARLSEAFSAGVGAPYFLDDQAFKDEIASLDAQWSAHESVQDDRLSRAVAATDMLRDWALHNSLTTSFRRFRLFFGAGVTLIVAGFVVAAVVLPPVVGDIKQPMVVEIHLEYAGARELREVTGCTEPTKTKGARDNYPRIG